MEPKRAGKRSRGGSGKDGVSTGASTPGGLPDWTSSVSGWGEEMTGGKMLRGWPNAAEGSARTSAANFAILLTFKEYVAILLRKRPLFRKAAIGQYLLDGFLGRFEARPINGKRHRAQSQHYHQAYCEFPNHRCKPTGISGSIL
jgi:hypothetical protein